MTDSFEKLSQAEEAELQQFFDAELAQDAAPSAQLMAAVLADATAQQPAARGLARAPAKWSWRVDFWQVLGGWQAGAALAASVMFGVGVGYASPDGLTSLTDSFLGSTSEVSTEDVYFSLDDLMVES